jgi:hypothetical protein
LLWIGQGGPFETERGLLANLENWAYNMPVITIDEVRPMLAPQVRSSPNSRRAYERCLAVL